MTIRQKKAFKKYLKEPKMKQSTGNLVKLTLVLLSVIWFFIIVGKAL